MFHARQMLIIKRDSMFLQGLESEKLQVWRKLEVDFWREELDRGGDPVDIIPGKESRMPRDNSIHQWCGSVMATSPFCAEPHHSPAAIAVPDGADLGIPVS